MSAATIVTPRSRAESIIDGIARRLKIQKQVISGCNDGVPLLLRWKISPKIYLHCFLRDDEDRELHDHPFSFVSLILWNGYIEVRPIARVRAALGRGERCAEVQNLDLQERRYYGPGALLRRPHTWAHRIMLTSRDRPSWSLVFRSSKIAEWGFFTRAQGWMHWKLWHAAKICDTGDDAK